MKFGGTSVGDVAAFERVFHIVSTQIEQRPVVVVSAMTKVTDALLAAFETAKKGDFAEALSGFATARQALGENLCELYRGETITKRGRL